ncbi:D-alanine-D-alanine ligase [Enterococcus sp. AZ196]
MLPAVVKPIDGGSSLGISVVETEQNLKIAVKEAIHYSNHPRIIIEDKIEGRDFSVGILGNQVLPVIEMIPKTGFYDYQNKYQKGRTEGIVPAKIDYKLADQLNVLAVKLHKILGLSVCSRTDFLVDKNNRIFATEINSLPSMTLNSSFSQAAGAMGLGFSELCECIIKESLKKYEK